MARLRYPALAALLAVALFAVPLLVPLLAQSVNAFAAGSVNTQKPCTLTISAPADMPELADRAIDVAVYPVAAMGADGSLTVTDAFGALQLPGGSYTEAEAPALAQEAAALVAGSAVQPAQTVTVTGSAAVSNLTPGLYLLLPQTVASRLYSYAFSPILVAVPSQNELGTWVYEREMILKAARSDRMGSLEITKSLDYLDTSLGSPTFVFEVTATLNDQVVYANQVAIGFTEAGVKKAVLSDCIPIGAQVAVTEVYSGVSYQLTSEATVTQVLETADEPLGFSFANTIAEDYPGGSGGGIQNAFHKDASGWQWDAYDASQQGEVA